MFRRRQKSKRNKAHRPKHIHLPVMPDLQREFMLASHVSLATLRLQPTADALEQLADLFNTVSIAQQDAGRSSVILDSGIRAMQDVVDRAERTGAIGVGRFELPPIENAVLECERLVKDLDVMRLHQAREKVFQEVEKARQEQQSITQIGAAK